MADTENIAQPQSAVPAAAEVNAAPVAEDVRVESLLSTPVAESASAPETNPEAANEPSKTETPAQAEPEKPEEAKPVQETKPTEEAKPEVVPEPKTEEKTDLPLPTYDTFKLPENFQSDDKAMGDFTNLLGQLENAKGDHKSTQEVGQKMVDLFASKLTEAQEKMTEYYVNLHNQDKQKMLDELNKDAYFGGNGDKTQQTKVRMELAGFLQRNVPKDQLNAFRQFVDERGIGDSLAVANVIKTLKDRIDHYEKESSRPLPASKPEVSKPSHPGKGIMQTLYGKK